MGFPGEGIGIILFQQEAVRGPLWFAGPQDRIQNHDRVIKLHIDAVDLYLDLPVDTLPEFKESTFRSSGGGEMGYSDHPFLVGPLKFEGCRDHFCPQHGYCIEDLVDRRIVDLQQSGSELHACQGGR